MQLQEHFRPCASKAFTDLIFSDDFKNHVKALDLLSEVGWAS